MQRVGEALRPRRRPRCRACAPRRGSRRSGSTARGCTAARAARSSAGTLRPTRAAVGAHLLGAGEVVVGQRSHGVGHVLDGRGYRWVHPAVPAGSVRPCPGHVAAHHRVDRHRPPDVVPGQVRRLARGRPAGQAVGVVPGRGPRRTTRRLRREHLLRPRQPRPRAGARRRGRRGLRGVPRLARAAPRRLRLGARLRDPPHRPVRLHHRRGDGPDRLVLRRRDERGPRDRAQAGRRPRRRARLRPGGAQRPRGDAAPHRGVPPARLPRSSPTPRSSSPSATAT